MSEQTVWAKAKDVLWERGWHQGGFEGDDGSVCLYGAIGVAVCGKAFVMEHGQPCMAIGARRYIGRPEALLVDTGRTPPRVGAAQWQDDPSTTFDDVLDVLDELDKAEREASAS